MTEDFRIEMESLRNKYAYDSQKNPLRHKITNLFYENAFTKEDQRLKLKVFQYHRKRIQKRAIELMIYLRDKLSFAGMFTTHDAIAISKLKIQKL